MTSKILETLKQFMTDKDSKTINSSDIFNQAKANLEYFEKFVTDPDVPNIVEMIKQVILDQASQIPNAQLSIYSPGRNKQYLTVSNSGNDSGRVVCVNCGLLDFMEISSGTFKEQHPSGPVVHINHAGNGNKNWEELTEKGVLVHGYCIPRNIADVVLKNFAKVEECNRNDVLLNLAASVDKTECYFNNQTEYVKKEIEQSGTAQIGIDENAVWTLEKSGNRIASYGNAHGFNYVSSM